MARPRLYRRVGFWPNVTYFKPAGIRMIHLEETNLTVDEFESVRLKDLAGLDQEQAAKKMKISQPTFFRLLKDAHKKIADALVNGKAIRIEGGVYTMVVKGRGRAGVCGGRAIGMRRRGGAGGRGRLSGFAAGPGGECECPACGTKAPHQIGVPCYQQKCPKCGARMTRAK